MIDRRIGYVFRPESITTEELLGEAHARLIRAYLEYRAAVHYRSQVACEHLRELLGARGVRVGMEVVVGWSNGERRGVLERFDTTWDEGDAVAVVRPYTKKGKLAANPDHIRRESAGIIRPVAGPGAMPGGPTP